MRYEEPAFTDMSASSGVLNHVKEGMKVTDVEGNKIGKVKSVHFGDERESTPGPDTVTGSVPPENNSLIENLAEAVFGDNDMPEAVKSRLLRYGFIRIDRGLLKSDALVTPENIVQVTNEEVSLNVFGKELVEA